MKEFDDSGKVYTSIVKTVYDEGLRQYFLKIYALMSSGLLITAITALAVFIIPALTNLMFEVDSAGNLHSVTNIGMLVSLAPLFISLYFAFNTNEISVNTARGMFWIYSAFIGASLASLGLFIQAFLLRKHFLFAQQCTEARAYMAIVPQKI